MSSNKILSEINAISQKIDIDKIKYYGILEEYPIPDIIDFEWKNILNKPPENSSAQTYKELLEIYNLSLSRSKQDIEFVYTIDRDPNKYLYDYLEKQKIEFPREEFDILYNIIKPILLNIHWQQTTALSAQAVHLERWGYKKLAAVLKDDAEEEQ